MPIAGKAGGKAKPLKKEHKDAKYMDEADEEFKKKEQERKAKERELATKLASGKK